MLNKESHKITSVRKNGRSLLIDWSDGLKSSYNFLWLRDNCPSDIHPTARERTFNLLTVSENIYPTSFKVKNQETLEIEWSEGNHTSRYESGWLRHNCYTLKNTIPFTSPYALWNNSMKNSFEKITIEYEEIMNGKDGLKKWLEQLHYFGISIVKNAPTEEGSGTKILNNISHFRETFFKTPFEVIDIPNPNNSAYTAKTLRNHIDLPYYEVAPGYQFLHCLINNASGGQSIAVDGFEVARYLKEKHEKYFKILMDTPVKFVNRDYTTNTIRVVHAPLISLDRNNDFNDIRFSASYMGIIDCHPDKMDDFYIAYRKFFELLHDQKFEVEFRLDPGDIFSFNNRRILHGRKEYNPNSGNRRLQGYYIDRDEIIGRLNFLNNIEP